MSVWEHISQHISRCTQSPFHLQNQTGVGGGCINQACRVTDGDRTYFVKTNSASRLSMFEAEYAGLSEMHASATIRVPKPVCVGSESSTAYLVMEFLPLGGSGSGHSIEQLGQRLAAMHRTTQGQYGWHRDNTIGSTPQINDYQNDWLTFWRENRLAYQLSLAARQGYGGRLQQRGEKLLDVLDVFFSNHHPEASLLHGDLWSGNYGVLQSGEPVIFDPAVYYGDRETDLAMTELFGGFPVRFYDAYHDAYPLDDGYAQRKILYNLYHILNHLNLFGSGYLGQAEGMIDRLLSDT